MQEADDFIIVIKESIAMVQGTEDKSVIKILVPAALNLSYLFDEMKEPAYKIAFLIEYLENIVTLVPRAEQVLQQLYDCKDAKLQNILCEEIANFLTEAIEREHLNPDLVTFWLQKTCDLHQIKNMNSLMLFLTPEQQKLILARDKSLMGDPKFILINSVLE